MSEPTFICQKCNQLRSLLTDIHPKFASRGWCIFCYREYCRKNTNRSKLKHKDKVLERSRKWYAKNKENVLRQMKETRDSTPNFTRISWLKKYGMTLEDYDKMFELQGGKCAICGDENSKNSISKHLFIDHDHDTKKVRGLLCHHCNAAMGHAGENINRLSKMVDYILERKTYSNIPCSPGLPW